MTEIERGHLSIIIEKNGENKEACTTNSEIAAYRFATNVVGKGLKDVTTDDVNDYYQGEDRNVIVTQADHIDEL